jgi:hypothetical protein
VITASFFYFCKDKTQGWRGLIDEGQRDFKGLRRLVDARDEDKNGLRGIDCPIIDAQEVEKTGFGELRIIFNALEVEKMDLGELKMIFNDQKKEKTGLKGIERAPRCP